MANHRNALVTVVRQELAEARGTARAVLAAAESRRSEALSRKKLVREAYATCLAQLAEARDASRQDVVRRFTVESAALSGSVASLAAICASGAAGAPWRSWAPAEPDRTGQAGLLRIGTIAYEQKKLPALVPLLDGAHLLFDGDQQRADGVISGVLLRALGTTRPGDLRLSVYDPEHLGGTLAAFGPLGNAELLSFVGPGGLGPLLDELVEHIRRVNESVLAGEYTSLAELTAASAGPRAEPWRVVVLLADEASAAELTSAQRAQLDRIVRTGVASGVHLLIRGLEPAPHPTLQRIALTDDTATCGSIGELSIALDDPPSAERVAGFCRSVVERLKSGPEPARLEVLEPATLWAESSAHGLFAPIGDGPDGELVVVPLGDDPPHALIGGPSGSGKTNLLYAWLGSLATRYNPAELAFYLLDFKGVSFARFSPGPREPSWLPQVHLAGVNVTGDREFGLAVLRHLGEELRFRAQAAKRHQASRLSELRAEDPEGNWPRIVAVIDEFPVLLGGRDAVAEEAGTLLEDLARRGRSYGIHLVLAAAELAGLEGLADLFPLRIALPKARGVLAEDNLAAALIPRFHAVVNADAGLAGANQIVRLPDAGDRVTWYRLQRRVWLERAHEAVPPRLFDGEAVPELPEAYRPGGPVTGDVGSSPGAVLGERIDVVSRPARLRLGRMPGRNLAVLGTRADEACDILASAALSLAAQGPAKFTVVCPDPEAEPAAAWLAAELPSADFYGPGDAWDPLGPSERPGESPGEKPGERPGGNLGEIPRYVLGYGLDALPGSRGQLRKLLETGPEQRIHVLGWWRSVARLRADLGGARAKTDAIGTWVALDVPGAELSPLSPQPEGPAWQPRKRRALFFDRSVHRTPEVIIPYEVNRDHT